MTIVRTHLRLAASAAAAVAAVLALPGLRWADRALIGWSVGAGLYIVLALTMMARTDADGLKRRAEVQDDGRVIVLAVTVAAAAASLGAIVAQLMGLDELGGQERALRLLLAAGTVIVSWLFTHTVFALHYAHEFFALAEEDGEPRGGLDFPGTPTPDYFDFLYFSVAIGTAAATSDTDVVDHRMRRLVTLHQIIAFLFNTSILGLTVNIAAGLVG